MLHKLSKTGLCVHVFYTCVYCFAFQISYVVFVIALLARCVVTMSFSDQVCTTWRSIASRRWHRSTKNDDLCVNTLRPRQNGRQFADDTLKRIFLNENITISIKSSLKFVPKGPINNIPALVQIMAWRRQGDKPLSEPMMVRLPTHIWVTRPRCVNTVNGC